MLLRKMEEKNISAQERDNEARDHQRKMQRMLKDRATLIHKTREFVGTGEMLLQKALYQQEAASSSPVGHQRQVREESKMRIKQLLHKEDKLIGNWKRLEESV